MKIAAGRSEERLVGSRERQWKVEGMAGGGQIGGYGGGLIHRPVCGS